MTLIRYPTGAYQYNGPVFWTGDFSNVLKDGAICRWLIQYLNSDTDFSKILLYIPCSDGDITIASLNEIIIYAENNSSKLVVGTVAQRFQDFSRFLFMPQDDGIFENGIEYYFPTREVIPWDMRKDCVFWRGACSADYKKGELLRRDVVEKLIDYPYADVKLIELWHENKPIPSNYFAPKVSYKNFLKYKYLLIIDGNGISSSHSWIFASGAVPVMITNNTFWFKKYLVPFENYVPIEYNLSDLIEKLDWLRENPKKAQEIAHNARKFAERVFSSDFQKVYLKEELKRLAQI